MYFIKREAAAKLIVCIWLKTLTRLQLLATCEPRWERLRNYEYEEILTALGGDWCISEWCPFDGRHCKLQLYVPYPHPPMKREPVDPPRVNEPWNDYTGPEYPEVATISSCLICMGAENRGLTPGAGLAHGEICMICHLHG